LYSAYNNGKNDFNQVGLVGKSYHIQPIRIVRLTNKAGGRKRVIIFSL
jgi:hypothetical protein